MSVLELLYPTPAPLTTENRPRPYIEIVEPPCKSLRFRYMCEGRPSTIPGASSTPENKTTFAVQIHGYQGRLAVIVSCVTKDAPYRQHPHQLIGHNCKYGVCSFEHEVTANNSIISFPKMAIQCVKRQNVKESLRIREEKNIDPYKKGFAHKEDVKSLDLNVMRLCVQVVLMGENRSRRININPVVTAPITNRKTLPDPVIHRMSQCNCYVNGTCYNIEQIILLCTKVTKDDIKIRFFETKSNQVVWEDYGTFQNNDVYNNTAICFRPPKYHNQNILEPVKVCVQLVRPSDDVMSPVTEFEYLPLHAVPGALKETRKNFSNGSPLFAQLLQTRTREEMEMYQPVKIARMDTNEPLLLDISSWTLPQAQILSPDQQETPQSINDINQTEYSGSRRSTQSDISNWNIPSDDLLTLGTDINIDSASGVGQVLNMDCNQLQLEPIHISSGDLEMAERLSGSFQEYLVI